MGINFRGTASRLKQMTEKRNPAGFQEKSAAGPRDGVGGEKVSLSQAESKFASRRSPFKMKKNFYGGSAYFSDGYDGSALKKTNPITQKSSPFKINMALVQGAADVHASEGFHDVAADVKKGFEPVKPTGKVHLGGKPDEPCEVEGQVKNDKGECVDSKDNTCPEGQEKNAEGICAPATTSEGTGDLLNKDVNNDETIISS